MITFRQFAVFLGVAALGCSPSTTSSGDGGDGGGGADTTSGTGGQGGASALKPCQVFAKALAESVVAGVGEGVEDVTSPVHSCTYKVLPDARVIFLVASVGVSAATTRKQCVDGTPDIAPGEVVEGVGDAACYYAAHNLFLVLNGSVSFQILTAGLTDNTKDKMKAAAVKVLPSIPKSW